MKQRLFSGIQPSGTLHLGNYFGAIKQWIALQEEYEAIFCVVDLHAITVKQDPKTLREKTFETAKIYMALGIDPEKSHIFVQSHVSEHTQLAWILDTVTRMSDLEKMTQFKDKVQQGKEASVGLFGYPVLMASDILLYDTEVVPVGDDQIQHVELTRTLARRFNKRFDDVFYIPEFRVLKEGARIMGLDDPTVKMSKSATSEYNFIALFDDAQTARKKIVKAVTDSERSITYEENRPGLQNLMNIYSLLSGLTPEEIVEKYQGKGCADLKTDLAEKVGKFLEDFQSKYYTISDDMVRDILKEGSHYATSLARKKMQRVSDAMGFVKK